MQNGLYKPSPMASSIRKIPKTLHSEDQDSVRFYLSHQPIFQTPRQDAWQTLVGSLITALLSLRWTFHLFAGVGTEEARSHGMQRQWDSQVAFVFADKSHLFKNMCDFLCWFRRESITTVVVFYLFRGTNEANGDKWPWLKIPYPQ